MPFEHISTVFAKLVGRPGTFAFCAVLAAFAIYAFSIDSDRLEWGANLAVCVVTVLLLPVLQATQNRDSAALHAKLDELIKANGEARNALIGLENRSVTEIEELRANEQAGEGD